MVEETATTGRKKGLLFHAIAKYPWLFILFLPVVLIVFVAVGFTRDNYIEDQVGEIWIPTSNNLAKDEEYLENLGGHPFRSSSIAAMALSRDSQNLLTESRLEEIRQRMNAIEGMTVELNGEAFTCGDVCASNSLGAGSGTTYLWPCARLSPMDLFQETRNDYFDTIKRLTWYRGVVKGAAIRPRILRFGIMQQSCLSQATQGTSSACDYQAGLRMNADFAESQGYPRAYANPLGLISDVGNLELSDTCRICIEESLEAQMDYLQNRVIIPFFTVLGMELRRYQANLTSSEDIAKIDEYASKAENIASTVNRKAVEDFYYYQVIRNAYAALGAPGYMQAYNQMITPESIPMNCTENPNCPPFNISLNDATEALKRHADNTFSSVSTAGSPLPLWSEGDGTGFMFMGTQPVSGSGIDMSGNITHAAGYIDLPRYGTAEWQPLYSSSFADPLNDPLWQPLVEKNPIYAWFMAGETEMTASCGNGNLTGTNFGVPQIDGYTAQMATGLTQKWCTRYNQPFGQDMTMTKQHFAIMWFDLLLDSDSFLGLTQGEDDPYTWTTGAGCDYTLGGERYSYTGMSETDILSNASRELYFIDEGASIGVVERHLLIGDASPAVGDYDFQNPLKEVGVLQSLYAALSVPEDIVKRVQNCNRPGKPINITKGEAEELLKKFKRRFDEVWSEGWDDGNAGEVQFVSFSDDRGVIGTTGVFLRDITLSNGLLTAVSILIIVIFSVFLMFSVDPIESRVLVTLFGVGLVVLSYFGALGLAIIWGIKLNVSTAFTLPFILVGLGVDDMYIVLMSLKKQRHYSERSFLAGMTEVVIPVTMTSLTNAAMFSVMMISDVPAVYLTARVALIAVCFLYLTIIFCFPAFCYLDMRRQAANRCDVAICLKGEERNADSHRKSVGSWMTSLLYDSFYRPVFLSKKPGVRVASQGLVWVVAVVLLGFGIWGLTEREVGLGLEDFFPKDHHAQRWASKRTETLASWAINIGWGELNYRDPKVQMKMIKQFEDVVSHPNVAHVDTRQLWIADFNLWTTRMCDANVIRSNPDVYNCGRDQVWPVDNSTCSGTWKLNEYGLKTKYFEDGAMECQPYEEGICRPTSQMHPQDLVEFKNDFPETDYDDDSVFCPVFEGWSNEKLGFCLKQWRFLTGGGGNLLLEEEHGMATTCSGEYYNTENVRVPIPYSGGPTLFSYGLTTHEITVDVIDQTRAICDDDEELHCWLSGIPYHYWSQYLGIGSLLLEVSGTSIAMGFVVAAGFLIFLLGSEGNHGIGKVVAGSLTGAFLIAVSMIASLVTVVGLSVLAGVNLTGFSLISFVLSVGFSVEYAVHVVHRWMHAPLTVVSSLERVKYSMEFLFLPTFMSFVSSTIGVATLAFTEFEFTQVFFFRPLIIVMFVTYFFGCWWLPACLCLLDVDFMKLGPEGENAAASVEKEIEQSDSGSEHNAVVVGSGKGPAVVTDNDGTEVREEVQC